MRTRGTLSAMTRRARRHSRLDDAVLNLLALAWLGRGMWRLTHGRPPWRAR